MRPIGAEALVALLEGGLDRVVLIDSRPFVDYNASHILEAVNVNCSKLMKRRLQQDKVQIAELLQHSAKKKVRGGGWGRWSHSVTAGSVECCTSQSNTVCVAAGAAGRPGGCRVRPEFG